MLPETEDALTHTEIETLLKSRLQAIHRSVRRNITPLTQHYTINTTLTLRP